MKLGIVGNEAAKFTRTTEARARWHIRSAIRRHKATEVVSGACPLGGIDEWAIEEAKKLGLKWKEFPPQVLAWHGTKGLDGYSERNLKIARYSDHVLCIVVEKLPKGYKGMRFPWCYHCKGKRNVHVKSGGCWTALKAKKRSWVII